MQGKFFSLLFFYCLLGFGLATAPTVDAQGLPNLSSPGQTKVEPGTELEEKIKTIKTAISELRNQNNAVTATLETEVEDAKKSALVVGLEKLAELDSIYNSQIDLLNASVRIRKKQEELKSAPENWLKDLRGKEAENSFIFLAKLEKEYQRISEDLSRRKSLIAATQEQLTDWDSSADRLEQEGRRVKEQINLNPTPTPPLNYERLVLDTRLARERANELKLQIAQAKAEQDFFDLELSLLDTAIKEADKNLNFSQEMLDEQLKGLDEQILALEPEINQLEKKLSQIKVTAGDNNPLRSLLLKAYNNHLVTLRDRHSVLLRRKEGLSLRYKFTNEGLSLDVQNAQRGYIQRYKDWLELRQNWTNQELSDFARELTASNLNTAGANAQQLEDVSKSFKALTQTSVLIREALAMVDYHMTRGVLASSKKAFLSGLFLKSKQTLLDIWQYEVAVVDDSPITVGKLLQALIIFILGLMASRFLAWRLGSKLLKKFSLEEGAAVAVKTMTFYALSIISAIIALHSVHIPLTVFTLAGGAVAIGVGFGSQTILKNFFSSLILLLEQPLRVGDVVEVGGVRGTVQRIGTRSTVLQTADQFEAVIPNSMMIDEKLINLTLSSNTVRRTIHLGVDYGSNVRDVSKILLSAAEEHGLVLKSPAPEVLFTNFGENSLDFTLRYWTKIAQGYDAGKIDSDLRFIIESRFRENRISLAFPQREVHLKVGKEPLLVQVIKN